MESQPQNPEFRNNPENFHPCIALLYNRILYMTSTMQPSLAQYD